MYIVFFAFVLSKTLVKKSRNRFEGIKIEEKEVRIAIKTDPFIDPFALFI